MAIKQSFLLCLFGLVLSVAFTNGEIVSFFNRNSFPTDFIFGAGISSYQCEGSPLNYGREPRIWDQFVKDFPEKISDASTAELTDDFYHRFKEDIKLAKDIGLDSFRFSISWPRILPEGKISGRVNPIGVKSYNEVIDEILANGPLNYTIIVWYDLNF